MWEKKKFSNGEKTWVEYSITLEFGSRKEYLRVWELSNGNWSMASLGHWVGDPVGDLETAKKLCIESALSRARKYLKILEEAKEAEYINKQVDSFKGFRAG